MSADDLGPPAQVLSVLSFLFTTLVIREHVNQRCKISRRCREVVGESSEPFSSVDRYFRETDDEALP
jgi:hypothetical protein